MAISLVGAVASPVQAGMPGIPGQLHGWGQRTIIAETHFKQVSAGRFYSSGLMTNGTVVHWGSYAVTQSGLSNLMQISSGTAHSLGLLVDGTVVGWGEDNSYGQLNPPVGLTDVVAVAAGGEQDTVGIPSAANSFSMALRRNGTVAVWGGSLYGQTSVPSNLTNVAAIAAGGTHCLALLSNGLVRAWGDAGTPATINVPANLSNVVSIAAAYKHSLALRSDGTVIAWGRNTEGQTNVPAGLSGVQSIAAGNRFSIAVRSNGTVVAWGSAGGLSAATNVPAGLSNVVSVACPAAGYHCLALKGDGELVIWGYNSAGQTNAPFGSSRSVVMSARGIFTLGEQVLALDNAGALQFWPGSLVPPTSASNLVGVAAGVDHCLGLKPDGTVIGWGNNSASKSTPPAGLSNIIAVAAGQSHSMALRQDGSVVAWGSNASGQTNVPPGLSQVTMIAAGSSRSLALRQDGSVVSWGLLDVPVDLTNVVAIAAGSQHCLALRNDGTVVAWGGSNAYGQTNVPSGLTDVIAIAAGDRHSLAVRAEGTVIAWGDNTYGQTNVISGLSNVIAVAAGRDASYAISAPLQFASIQITNQSPALRFHTFAGQNYEVQRSTNLSLGDWSVVPNGTVVGTGRDAVIVDTNAINVFNQLFYRLRQN